MTACSPLPRLGSLPCSWWGGLCVPMTPRATWAESCTPGRVTHAEQVEGQEPDEE